MTRDWFPWIGGAALVGGAVFFAGPIRVYLLLGIMLGFPLIDPAWRPPKISVRRSHWVAWCALALTIALVVVTRRVDADTVLAAILIAALPEEWFFRAYFMVRLNDGTGLRSRAVANLLASLLFCVIHGLSRDWTAALLVLGPSLFYGWLYQRTRDLVLLVLTHAVSNVLYIAYFALLLRP